MKKNPSFQEENEAKMQLTALCKEGFMIFQHCILLAHEENLWILLQPF